MNRPRNTCGRRAATSLIAASLIAAAAVSLSLCPTADTPVATSAAMVLTAASAIRQAPFDSPGSDAGQTGVVMLFASASPGQMAAGTGIVLTPDGVGLTNAHVVQGARQIVAHDTGHGADCAVTVLGTDPAQDIAVIKIVGAKELAPARWGDSTSLRVGQRVTAVGNVGGSGSATTNEGVVTALHRRILSRDAAGGHPEWLDDMIETDAWVRPGDSGGPLFNASGRVIGVNSAADGRHGYAIGINHALAVARTLTDLDIDAPPRGDDDRAVRDSDTPHDRPEHRERPQLLNTRLELGSHQRPARHWARPSRRAESSNRRPDVGRPLLGLPGRGGHR